MGCEICSRGEARRGRGLGRELVRELVALRGCVGVETRGTIIATSYHGIRDGSLVLKDI